MTANIGSQIDFSKNYGNHHLSDVALLIYEEPPVPADGDGLEEQLEGLCLAAPGASAAVAEELPGHGVLLMAMSGYCCVAVSGSMPPCILLE